MGSGLFNFEAPTTSDTSAFASPYDIMAASSAQVYFLAIILSNQIDKMSMIKIWQLSEGLDELSELESLFLEENADSNKTLIFANSLKDASELGLSKTEIALAIVAFLLMSFLVAMFFKMICPLPLI